MTNLIGNPRISRNDHNLDYHFKRFLWYFPFLFNQNLANSLHNEMSLFDNSKTGISATISSSQDYHVIHLFRGIWHTPCSANKRKQSRKMQKQRFITHASHNPSRATELIQNNQQHTLKKCPN